MKKIVNYISVIVVAILAYSCETNLDKVTYDSSNATAAIMKDLDPSYTLDAQKSGDVAITFEWSEADMGYSAAVTNKIELDIAGNEFANKITIGSINKGGVFEVTHQTLNNSLIGLLESHEMEIAATDFDIRICSSISEETDPIYSSIITTNITPFVGERIYPFIAIRGDYAGWDFANSQKIYSAESDDNYAGMIFFDGKAANGWKLCETEDWSINWGITGSEAAEAPSVTLSGGENISIYSKNCYSFEFNKTSKLLKVTATYDSWGIVGSHNNWGGEADTEMSLSSEVNTTGGVDHFLTATLDLVAKNEWKIRADNKWVSSFGPGQFEGEFTENEGNFLITEDGNYTIKWYFNKVTQNISIVKN